MSGGRWKIFPRGIPRQVWVLGLVSMLMDISSEMIHSILPLFMVASLGMSAMAVGLIEGLAEALAQIVKVFSGGISDYIGKRKGLTVLGYALGAASKPFMVAASAPADLRGTAFGFFNLASGLATLAASLTAGWLWSACGPAFTFYAGAVFALASLPLLYMARGLTGSGRAR